METEHSRAQIMRRLVEELPLNDFGLPTGIYRPDLIPFDLYQAHRPRAETPADAVPPAVVDELARLESPSSLPERAVATPPIVSPSEEDEDEEEGEGSPFFADTAMLLSGMGDGLPDEPIKPRITREITIGNGSAPKHMAEDGLPDLVPEPSNGVAPRHPKALVPQQYFIAGFPAKAISPAFVPLQYDEGFPAFESGVPFWARMDFEPLSDYQVFQRFLTMNMGRAPSGIGDSEAGDEDPGVAASGVRAISTLVALVNPTATDKEVLSLTEHYKDCYHQYYWGLRAKAYDMYRVVEYRQKQELRAIETQDDHYIQSRKLRARLSQYMDSDEEFWDMMTPKVAIDMFKTLTGLERISAGVPAAGPQNKAPEHANVPFELAFRTIAQSQAKEVSKGDDIDEGGNVLDRALEDENAVKILQELIIKSGGSGSGGA